MFLKVRLELSLTLVGCDFKVAFVYSDVALDAFRGFGLKGGKGGVVESGGILIGALFS